MIAGVADWGLRTRAAATVRVPGRRRAVEVALLACLVFQAGRAGWILFAPSPAPAPAGRAAPAPVDPAVFRRFDPFFRTGEPGSLAEEAASRSDALRLFGVRAGGADGGSAILGLPDGRQVSAAVGETIAPGLTLASVGEDFVTVSRGGSVSRIAFSETPAGAAVPPPPPPTEQVVTPTGAPGAEPAMAVVDPGRLMEQVSLRPRLQGLSVKGFVVTARGDGAALRAAGLQSGDVVLAVNGTELNDSRRLAGLRSELSSASTAEIRFERNGEVRTITMRTGQ